MPQRQHETCTVDGCTRAHKSRGYCQTHYTQWRRGVPIAAEIKSRQRQKPECCTESGCSEPVKAKGLCKMHYARLLRHGFTRRTERTKPLKTCTVVGCSDHFYASGFCNRHYMRFRKARSFGLSMDDVAAMLTVQNGACAICGNQESSRDGASGKLRELNLDHCHTSGRPRALLCNRCNRGLGYFRDSTDVLRSAIAYLGRFAAPAPQSS